MFKYISVHGSYFGRNFGDTLLINSFIEAARDAGVQTVNCPLAIEADRKLLKADSVGLDQMQGSEALVFAGGGYFSESTRRPWIWSVRHLLRYVSLARLAKWRGIPFGIFGVEVGPLTNPVTRRTTAWMFRNATACTVRNHASLDYLRELGVTHDIPVGIDTVAFGDSDAFKSCRIAENSDRRKIAVHVLATVNDNERALLAGVLAAARKAKPKLELTVFSDHFSDPASHIWPQSIIQQVDEAGGVFAPYNGVPEALIELLSRQDLVVTSKLHVGISAAALGKAVIACPVHPKTRRFYEELDRTDIVVGLDEPCAAFVENRVTDWINGHVDPISLGVLKNDIHRSAMVQFLAGR